MVTIAFWKPFDVLSKFTDDAVPRRSTLADFIDLRNVYGAGRLDRDSEGLLILSDNPDLRAVLTEPDHHIERRYWVQVEGEPDTDALMQLRNGVLVKGKLTRPAKASKLRHAPDIPDRSVPIRHRETVPDSWIEVTLTEGRNRQVRKMTAAVGHPTLRLVRNQIGSITLDGLVPGRWRKLARHEENGLASR